MRKNSEKSNKLTLFFKIRLIALLLLSLRLAYEFVNGPSNFEEAKMNANFIRAEYIVYEGKILANGLRELQLRLVNSNGNTVRFGCKNEYCEKIPSRGKADFLYYDKSILSPRQMLLSFKIENGFGFTKTNTEILQDKWISGLLLLFIVIVFLVHLLFLKGAEK